MRGFGVALIGWYVVSIVAAQEPPRADLQPVVDNYHGVEIADPYRYLEDFADPGVRHWVKRQAEYADQTLRSIPGRDHLRQRIAELALGAPYRVFGFHRRPNGDLFYFKQLATENVAKYYVRRADSQLEQLLIDPETFPTTEADQHVTLSFCQVSPDGNKVAYGFAASGSEQTTLRIYDLALGRDLPETIDRIEAEYALPTWLPDSTGFTYSRRQQTPPDAPPTDGYKFTQAFLHTLGTSPEHNRMIFADGAPGSPKLGEMDFPAVLLSIGSDWAIGQVKHGDETDISLYVAPRSHLVRGELTWSKVCDRGDLVTEFAVNGNELFLRTASRAPRFKVIRVSIAEPNLAKAAVVVPAGLAVVTGFAAAKDALYVETSVGVPTTILRVPYDGGASTSIELPAYQPSAFLTAVRPDMPGVWLATASWSRKGRLLAFDPVNAALKDTGLLPIGEFDAPNWLTSTEVMVPGHDGVKVPLSIIHRKDIRRDGTNPTILSGYGAYGFTNPMSFDPILIAWLERGGVLAIAHVRGGGEFGKEWHHAGRRSTKPNTWKDFIACAEHLIQEKYTSPTKLAGEGRSAGGILIGRAITERPDLFAAAHIAVGCTDLLRFETTMNGPPNIPEFGTVTKADEFQHLLAMSSYHQVKMGMRYPAVLLTHGINDPRVEPWQSAKMAARLAAATASGKPVLFRVDYQAGHGIGSTKGQRHDELADVWAFCLWQMGDPDFQPSVPQPRDSE